MELGEACPPLCNVPHHPQEFERIWLPRVRSGTKVCHLFLGIKCDKTFTAIVTVRANPESYGEDLMLLLLIFLHMLKNMDQQ